MQTYNNNTKDTTKEQYNVCTIIETRLLVHSTFQLHLPKSSHRLQLSIMLSILYSFEQIMEQFSFFEIGAT